MSLKKTLIALAIVATTTSYSLGQTTGPTGDQLFTVEVPVTVEVTAPADAAPQNKPEKTDANVEFLDTVWSVIANDIDGSTITFEAEPFLTTQGATSANRNTQLDLTIASQIGYSGATNLWSVTTATDTTAYLTSVTDKATVTATSTNAANAVFNLDVTFISGVYGTYASGTYTTTVVATIAGNVP